MKRFHLHMAVDNLADSIRFYSAMFAAEPSVQKSDYAKWMLESIPVFGQNKDGCNELPEAKATSGCCIPLAIATKQLDAPCCVPTAEQAATTAKCC